MNFTRTGFIFQENKPPSEKHDSTRKHRHKKSHKSKRKHKQHDHDHHHHELKVKPIKTEPFATPSYSSVIVDPIEDIITKTLNADSESSYPRRDAATIVPPPTNYSDCSVPSRGDRDKMELSDYRRVPPMKIALKKFAQENSAFQNSQPSSATRNSHHSSTERNSHSSSVLRTTVGDLVCSEIEKSLEISNRSIVDQAPTPLVYNTVGDRSVIQRPSGERKGKRNREESSVPSDTSRKSKSREEPFEG